MPIGTNTWFEATKGYGFIQPEDGPKDAALPISDLPRGQQGRTQATNPRKA